MKIPYKIRNSKRAKRMSLLVHFDGTVVAVKPWWVKEKSIESFVNRHAQWIEKTLDKFRKDSRFLNSDLRLYDKKHYLRYKKEARRIIVDRLEEINKNIGFEYNKVSIRNQRSRWGSCSESGNLNFNYKLMFHKPEVMDYIIIHELCHLKEMNHGAKFWELVSKYCPEYKEYERQLRGGVK